MTYQGTVKNGVVVLPADVVLREGSLVEVTPRELIAPCELIAENDPFLALVLKLAKPRPHLPDDYALNHGHYVSGEPKR